MKHALRVLAILGLFGCSSGDFGAVTGQNPPDSGLGSTAGTSDGSGAGGTDADVVSNDGTNGDWGGTSDGSSARGTGEVSGFAIESVSGSLAAGELVTVTGGGFGSHGPRYVFVSDFDVVVQQNGDTFAADNRLAGAPPLAIDGAEISDLARSGNRSFLASGPDLTVGLEGSNRFDAEDFDEFFLAMAKYDVGEGTDEGRRKDVWVMRGDRGDNIDWGGEGSGQDIVLRHNAVGGNNTLTFGGTIWRLNLFNPVNRWVNWSYWIRNDPDDPYNHGNAMAWSSVDGDAGLRVVMANQSTTPDMTSNDTPPMRDRFKLGAWFATSTTIHHDDYYIAIGDHDVTSNAAARIEFFNAPKYDEATARSLCVIESWTDTRITCRPMQGGLDWASDTVYCVVFDKNSRRTKEFNCSENKSTGRRLIYFTYADADEVDDMSASFAVNRISDRTTTGTKVSDAVDIQGESTGITVVMEQSAWTSERNGGSNAGNVEIPGLFGVTNWMITGSESSLYRISGLPPNTQVQIRAWGQYYQSGNYLMEVVTGSASATHNAASNGTMEPVTLETSTDPNGAILLELRRSDTSATGNTAFNSWFSVEFVDPTGV